MITKILFTLVVIVAVIVFFRVKNEKAHRDETAKRPTANAVNEEIRSIQPRMLAYILIALLIALSTGIYAYHWNQGNRIINIRVTSDNGAVINYQAHHKDIDGRDFISLDGVHVTLGSNDRMEILSR